ncbi:C40 family peptidase [Bacillus freudenreichii]|nr:C40 family peptidase [Bacillus freudenreichii]
MKNRLLASVLGAGLIFSSIPNVEVYAHENLDQEISAKKQEVSTMQEKEREMNELLGKLEAKVNETNEKINSTKKDISKNREEAKQLEKDIAEVEERMEKRFELMKKRARAVQQTGSSSYIDVLLEAESFSDFVDRSMALTKILNADKSILEEQEKDKQTLEASETELKTKLEKVQSELKEIENLKEQLTYQVNDKNSMLAAVKEQRSEASKELEDLENQKAIIIAEAKKAEEEKAAKEANTVAAEENGTAETVAKSTGNAAAQQTSKNSTVKKSSATSNGGTAKKPSATSNAGTVQASRPAAPSAPTVKKGSGAIETAISTGSSIVGRSPYKWGGGRTAADIQNRRFDCSSFVRWAYASAGVNLGWTTSELVNQGRAVSASEMKRGDLVFFDTYKRNGHVGIYLGNGTFLNDNSSHGVSVDSMSNTYWKGAFKGVVRRVVE